MIKQFASLYALPLRTILKEEMITFTFPPFKNIISCFMSPLNSRKSMVVFQPLGDYLSFSLSNTKTDASLGKLNNYLL